MFLGRHAYLKTGTFTVAFCTSLFLGFVVLSVDTVNFVTEGALKSLGVFSGGWLQVLFTSRGRDGVTLSGARRYLSILVHCRLDDGIYQPDGHQARSPAIDEMQCTRCSSFLA